QFERFDPRTISWESVPSMKTKGEAIPWLLLMKRFVHNGVISAVEQLYAFGGFDELEMFERSRYWILALALGRDGDSMHQPRVSGFGAVVIGESIYVIGGNATEVAGDNAVLSIMPQPMAESQR
ncbi:hypothetical protein IFM89_039291, partial [Coptis chinensis]